MAKHLVVIDGADQGRSFALPETGTVTIGKNKKHADIVLNEPQTLWSMYRTLDDNATATVSTDAPIKDIALKPRRTWLERIASSRAGTFLSAPPPVSPITATDTTRSITASTSSTSHFPSDNFVSRSESRTVCCAMASAKCSPQ